MKFSIRKDCPVDEVKLETELFGFRRGEDPSYMPYIFMNKETANNVPKLRIKNAGTFEEAIRYLGYKVFIDNTLGYGEIELR